MLANVGMLGIGVPLAPVTWAFGPIATLNVALTMAPVLSALGMFVLLRRWVTWVPAAFVGGLLYGFSPFVLSSLTLSHLMLGLVAIPPLVAAVLDELLIRQRARPIRAGVLLGVLVTLQFFISTEVLVLTLVAAGVALILVVVYAALSRPADLRDHAHYAVVGLSAGVVTAVALLGYFVWFALDGPAHLSGPIWGGSLSQSGSNLTDFFTPTGIVHPSPGHVVVELLNGYSGTNFSPQYFGVGVFIVAVGGLIVWRHDRRLWLFAAVGLVSTLLSLGVSKNTFLPWQLLANLPEFENVIPGRFVLIIYLCLAVMLGLIVDHTCGAVRRWSDAKHESSQDLTASGLRRRPTFPGPLAAVLVATIALLPIATYLAQAVPVAAQSVVLPRWFHTAAPRLSADQVLLVLPMPGLIESPLTWQVVGGMHYAMVDGAGPESLLSRAGSARRGQAVIADDTSSALAVDLIRPGDVAAVRRSLDDWGVTMVVISAQAPSGFEVVTSVPLSVALMTAATGQRPIEQLGDWVWSGVRHSPSPRVSSAASVNRCVHGAVSNPSSIERMVSCILGD